MRKRILILGHSYNLPFTHVYNQYAKIFPKDKFEVTIAYLVGEPNSAVRDKTCAEQVEFFNYTSKEVRGLKIKALFNLIKLQRKKNYYAIIAHRYKPIYLVSLMSFFCRVPFSLGVLHMSGTTKRLGRKLFYYLMAKRHMKFAGVSTAISQDILQNTWGLSSHQVVTLHNSLDIEQFEGGLLTADEARRALTLERDAFIFGTIGRLVSQKDHKTLLHAFARVTEQLPTAKLAIIGGGELEQPLKKLANELNIQDKVIFCGFCQEAFRYIKAFDVYVSSSINEGMAIAMLEAMLASVPIIATQAEGVVDALGETGFIVPLSDPLQLAAVMLSVARLTKEQRGLSGSETYKRLVNNFTTEQFSAQFWQHFAKDFASAGATSLGEVSL